MNRPLFAGNPEVSILCYGKEQMWKQVSTWVANVLFEWCSNTRANLKASQRQSSRLRPRLVAGLIRFARGIDGLRLTAVGEMALLRPPIAIGSKLWNARTTSSGKPTQF